MKILIGLSIILFALTALPPGAYGNSTPLYSNQDQDEEQLLRINWTLFHEDFRNEYFERAIPYGWKVMELDPTRFRTLYRNLAECYRQLYLAETDPDLRTAYADTIIIIFQKGIEYLPDRATDYYLQKAHFYENYYSPPKAHEAINAYEKAIEDTFDTIEFVYIDRLGNLYIDNRGPDNDYEERAIALYQRYLTERDPGSTTAMDRLSRVMRDPSELISLAETRLRTDPDNPTLIWSLVQAYKNADKYDEAIPHVKKLTEINPESETYWTELARLYERVNDPAKTIETYRELMNLRPNDEEIPLEIARIYRQIGNYQSARLYARRANRMNPNWGEPLIEIATIYEAVVEQCVVESKGGWANMDLSDRVVYKLAQEYYQRAARIDSRVASRARERAEFLNNLVPQDEDYFFNRDRIRDGKIKVFGDCYEWIDEAITVPDRFL